ncbi:chromosome partitioning protein ParA, partial [Campylobacter jejuni]|nr:chromosome partitioning protein ParA [Campylobacter jejuni]
VIFQREKYKIFTQMGLGVIEENKKDDKAYLEMNKLCEFIKKLK